MTRKNPYLKFGKINERKFREIIRYFALELTASGTASLTGISLRSISSIFIKIRHRLAAECEKQTPFSGTIVFGVLKRGDSVYTEIVPNASSAALSRVVRVHHGENEFARGSKHINGIESFWSFAKARLMKFKGVPKHTFYSHLKETEFRFYHRHKDLYKTLLKLLRNNPI